MDETRLSRRDKQVLKVIRAEPQRMTYRNPYGGNGSGYLLLEPSGEHTRGTVDVLKRAGLVTVDQIGVSEWDVTAVEVPA
jgi:hypothetical protein